MKVITDLAGLAPHAGGLFVPTMGALHAGHFTLVRAAVAHGASAGNRRADVPIIVSVFVNPTQFNDPKDLERYPRTLDADVAGCAAAGADVVFAPGVDAIYPPGAMMTAPG